MEYDELAPYSYQDRMPLAGVLRVGWIDRTFVSGRPPTPEDMHVASVAGRLQFRTSTRRSQRACPVCQQRFSATDEDGSRVPLGSAELWIPSDETLLVYVAPDLLPHFIQNHGYRAPDEFIRACKRVLDSRYRHWDAASVCDFVIGMELRRRQIGTPIA